MTQKKTVRKRARKSQKQPNLFLDSPEVTKNQTKLDNLRQDHRKLINNLGDVVDNLEGLVAKTAGRRGESFLDKLPLNSLKDFGDFSDGKKKDSSMDILKNCYKLRKEKEDLDLKLDKLESEIVEGQIDVLLAKINYVINKT